VGLWFHKTLDIICDKQIERAKTKRPALCDSTYLWWPPAPLPIKGVSILPRYSVVVSKRSSPQVQAWRKASIYS
jgi:hypothetical protein